MPQPPSGAAQFGEPIENGGPDVQFWGRSIDKINVCQIKNHGGGDR